MKRLSQLVVLSSLVAIIGVAVADDKKDHDVPAALDFKMKSLEGKPVTLSQYKGKVVLMVNVASQCGLTPQYKELQSLHDEYAKDGLVILGFPANDFGRQEPGTDQDIAAFCEENYGVKFQMFSKVVVKGKGQCDLYKYLTSKKTNPKFAGPIKWNFEKFLIGRNGEVISRFSPQIKPKSPEVVGEIEKELSKKQGA